MSATADGGRIVSYRPAGKLDAALGPTQSRRQLLEQRIRWHVREIGGSDGHPGAGAVAFRIDLHRTGRLGVAAPQSARRRQEHRLQCVPREAVQLVGAAELASQRAGDLGEDLGSGRRNRLHPSRPAHCYRSAAARRRGPRAPTQRPPATRRPIPRSPTGSPRPRSASLRARYYLVGQWKSRWCAGRSIRRWWSSSCSPTAATWRCGR